MALRGPSPRDRGETVRKLSPYDVFPPSQRRFRRDRKGSQESYGSVGVMENRGKECVGNPHQEKRKENVYESERKCYLCSSLFHLWMTSCTAKASQEEGNI